MVIGGFGYLELHLEVFVGVIVPKESFVMSVEFQTFV